jgi:hypothetical protein
MISKLIHGCGPSLLLLLLLLCVAAGVHAQEGKKQLVIPMKGGYFVAFTTDADPSNARA